jgi:hypothetical protein
MLYYLAVTVFGFYLPASRTAHQRKICSITNLTVLRFELILIHFWPRKAEPRFRGRKHGHPASTDAAEPQGINDQFFTGFDTAVSRPTEV